MQNFRLENGQKLNNRYKILRCIGQGGFGITYMAEDEVLGQNVVVKEYFPITIVTRDSSMVIHISDENNEKKRYEEGMKRFLQEAQVLASLFDVSGVVKVLDYFKENETAYIVMEHIKGVSLRDFLERSGEMLSFEKALQIMLPVMNALERIHKKGLLHRDLNPDNLMVEEDGNIKLLDFGSAREYFLEQDREKTMTILVKNGYAPPEQYERKGKQGPWTDIYSLCATMYEMMTGCMPPGSKERQVFDELYAPSTFDVDITPEQEEIFLNKGMALDVSQRFSSVSQMKETFFGKSSGTKKSSKKVVVGMIFALIIAALAGVWCYVTKEYEEDILYAGNYERGSEEYDSFIQFVRENALESEEYAVEGLTLPGTKYTLSEDIVKQIGLPGNDYRMDVSVKDILESAGKIGHPMKKVEEETQFYVYEEPFGTIRTTFSVNETYVADEGYQLEICSDYFDGNITYMFISMTDGQNAYNQFALDLMHEVCPYVENNESILKEMDEMLVQYKADYLEGSNTIYGYQWGKILYFYRMYEETGDKVHLKIVPENIMISGPTYNW